MAQLVENLAILPLPPDFQAGGFSCGQGDVDGYLAENALDDEIAYVTRTYLVRDDGQMVAYISVLCDGIKLQREERPTAHPGAPALKVGLMGVRSDYRSRQYQSRSIGLWLLDWAVGLARSLSMQAGLRYVTLDSLPEPGLVRWYEGYGFKKNLGEERARRIIKRSGLRKNERKKTPLEAIVLPHVSMRFDIQLKGEAPATPIEVTPVAE